jgi:hypothetical protein
MRIMISDLVEEKNGDVIGVLAWEHGGAYFPSSRWIDSPGTLLSWWISALRSFRDADSQIELMFMEGPYKISLEKISSGLFRAVTEDGVFSDHVTLKDVALEVSRGARYFVSEALKHRWAKVNINAWERALNLLEPLINEER